MPGAERPLNGVAVLVTRPEGQAEDLVRRVRDAGGEPVRFPTLLIVPVAPAAHAIEALNRADMVIFISPNAVAHGYPYLRVEGGARRQVIAIGAATKAALVRHGCTGVHDPGEHSSSEALLARDILQDVSGRRVCIVRGRGGRELLRDALAARGARVDYLECYRRARPEDPDTSILEQALDRYPDSLVVTATSTAGLVNLIEMAPRACRERLLARPLVVIGGRQETAAGERGWRGPVLAAGAGDEQLVETLAGWRRTEDGSRR